MGTRGKDFIVTIRQIYGRNEESFPDSEDEEEAGSYSLQRINREKGNSYINMCISRQIHSHAGRFPSDLWLLKQLYRLINAKAAFTSV